MGSSDHDSSDEKQERDLLNDLESLKSLLDEERAERQEARPQDPEGSEERPESERPIMAIPTLDRVLETPPNPPSEEAPSPSRGVDLELLIQEVIDEVMPTVEARLRERLLDFKEDDLRRLLENR